MIGARVAIGAGPRPDPDRTADLRRRPLGSSAAEVVQLLKDRKETISVAETAAGGLISAALLSTPGASSIYKGGLTLYTLQSRIAFAGWTQRNIDEYRGPTPDIVAGLAENVRDKLESTYCVCEVCIPKMTHHMLLMLYEP